MPAVGGLLSLAMSVWRQMFELFEPRILQKSPASVLKTPVFPETRAGDQRRNPLRDDDAVESATVTNDKCSFLARVADHRQWRLDRGLLNRDS